MRPDMVAGLFARVQAMRLPDAAAALAAAGVPVFPCWPGGKNPRIKADPNLLDADGAPVRGGFHQATTDPAQVARWWRAWPGANIGVPTGQASGLVVVDVDRKLAGDGFTAFRAARNAGLLGGPDGGWAAVVRSPSGGAHFYFPADPDRPASSWQAPKALIDLRGDGGYIIVPPSIITSRTGGTSAAYTLAAGASPAVSPVDGARLRDFLDPRPVVQARQAVPPLGGDAVEHAQRLAGWVALREEGERNRGLFWASCRLAEAGASLPELLDALTEPGQRAGLPPREVAATIRSAYRAVHVTPAPASTAPSAASSGRFGTNRAEIRTEGRAIA